MSSVVTDRVYRMVTSVRWTSSYSVRCLARISGAGSPLGGRRRSKSELLRTIPPEDILFICAGTQGVILAHREIIINWGGGRTRIPLSNVESVSMSRQAPWFFLRNLTVVYDDYPRSPAPKVASAEIRYVEGLRLLETLQDLRGGS